MCSSDLPTDLADVTGYTFLVNGKGPADNWTGLFKPGEKVRLRFVNGSAMTLFDVRVPGLKLKVIQADGQDVEPVTVESVGAVRQHDFDARDAVAGGVRGGEIDGCLGNV